MEPLLKLEKELLLDDLLIVKESYEKTVEALEEEMKEYDVLVNAYTEVKNTVLHALTTTDLETFRLIDDYAVKTAFDRYELAENMTTEQTKETKSIEDMDGDELLNELTEKLNILGDMFGIERVSREEVEEQMEIVTDFLVSREASQKEEVEVEDEDEDVPYSLQDLLGNLPEGFKFHSLEDYDGFNECHCGEKHDESINTTFPDVKFTKPINIIKFSDWMDKE